MTEPAAGPAGIRVDPDAVDPAWPGPLPSETPTETSTEAPTEISPGPGRSRTLLVVCVVLLVLALLAGIGWRAGAFGVRTDRRWVAAPGSTVTTGPFEFTFTKLTLQKKQSYSKDLHYEVQVSGTGRTTGDESLAPRYTEDKGMFLARDDASGAIAQPESLLIGTSGSAGKTFTPGLAPTPITVTFSFDASLQPPATLSFVVIEQVLRDNSLLGNQDPEWRNGKHYFHFEFPVTRLPDDIVKA